MIDSIDCEVCAICGESDYHTLVDIDDYLSKLFSGYHRTTEIGRDVVRLMTKFSNMPVSWFCEREPKIWGYLCKIKEPRFVNVATSFNCSDGTRQLFLRDEYFELLDKINTLQDAAYDYFENIYDISFEDLLLIPYGNVFEIYYDMCSMPREAEYYLRQPHSHIVDLIVEYPDFKKVLEGLDVRVQY